MANFNTLREANVARQDEWDPAGTLKDWSWRCNELAGEAGELCNILKKLHREHLNIPGSRATKDDLADELADVVICADLCAMQAGADSLPYIGAAGHAPTPLPRMGMKLVVAVGAVCSEDAASNAVPSYLRRVAFVAMAIAQIEHINLEMAVSHKFNATSHKVGLRTTLRYTEPPIVDPEDFANRVMGAH